MGAATAFGTGLGVGRPLPARWRVGGERRFTPSPPPLRPPPCLAPTHPEACGFSAAVITSGAFAASTVPLGQGCFTLGSGTRCEVGRGVQGRGMVRWHGSALPGDAERVCVWVRVRHPAPPPTSAWNGRLPSSLPAPAANYWLSPLPPAAPAASALVRAFPETGRASPSPPEK